MNSNKVQDKHSGPDTSVSLPEQNSSSRSETNFSTTTDNSNNAEPSGQSGKMTVPLAFGAALAMLTGSIPSGYNVGVVNTPQIILQAFCNETLVDRNIFLSDEKLNFLWSVCVAALLLGAIPATNFSGTLANMCGRKGALVISGLLSIISSILFVASYASGYVEVFIVGRMLSGLHSGLTSGLVPLYMAEIAPASLKGVMGVFHTVGLGFGMILSQVLGQATLLGTERLWTILLAFSAFFIIAGFFLYNCSPSSPVYYYIVKKQHLKAADELVRIRRSSKIEYEISELKRESKEQELNKQNWTFLSIMASPEYRGKVLLVIFLHLGQQFSGVNAVFYYSTSTFLGMGMTMQQAQYGSITIVIINAVTCFLTMHLLKKWRRRTHLFTSIWGGIFCTIGITITMHLKDSYSWASAGTVIFFCLFVFLFALGNGSIPWLLPSELLPQSTLGAVMGIGALTNWIGNFTVALLFPVLDSFFGDSAFLVFTGFALFEIIVLYSYLPETNAVGKSTSTEAIITSSPSNLSADTKHDIQNDQKIDSCRNSKNNLC